MNIEKLYEVKGFDTDILERGQAIKVKYHMYKVDVDDDDETFNRIYLIKDIDINKIELLNFTGEVKVEDYSRFAAKPEEGGYYEIIEIFNEE